MTTIISNTSLNDNNTTIPPEMESDNLYTNDQINCENGNIIETDQLLGNPHEIALSSQSIRNALRSSSDPIKTIREIQHLHAPKLSECEPVIRFLEKAVGIKRFDLYLDLCEHLKERLFQDVRGASKNSLLELLLRTLPFIVYGSPLSDVAITVLSATPEIPGSVLEQLSTMDSDVFEKIPRHVRQQVWARFPRTFQEHLDERIDRYLRDHSTNMCNDEMHPDRDFPQPNKRREKCAALQEIVRAIGGSGRLYRFATDEIRERFAQTGNLKYCALRADLLMAMHDVMNHTVKQTEPCFQFAWTLDAYVKEIVQHVSQDTLDLKLVTQYQNRAVDELDKIRKGILDSKLVSAFATQIDCNSVNSGSARRPTGWNSLKRPHTNRAPHQSTPMAPFRKQKCALDLSTVLMDTWKKIKNLDKTKSFMIPVVEEFPNLETAYRAKVKNPMDLQSIQGKIKKREYSGLVEMRADVHLIVHNAVAFNGAAHPIAQLANSLLKVKAEVIFDKAFRTLEYLRVVKMEDGEENKAISLSQSGTPSDAVNPKESQAELEARLQSAAEISREQARVDETRMENDALLEQEETHRLGRLISDAAMILASGVTVHALGNVFWFLLGEECCKTESLPRDAILVRNTAWLLQNASRAHVLVSKAQRGLTVSMPDLSPRFEREVMPTMTHMLLESCDFRAEQQGSSEEVNQEVHLLNPSLEIWCKYDLLVPSLVLHFFCGSVLRRDVPMIAPMVELLKKIGPTKLAENGSFMHSLTTAFFIASLKERPVMASDRNRTQGKSSGTSNDYGWRLPRLTSELLSEIIRLLYLPAVLMTSPLTTCQYKTAAMHTHFSRLLALEFTRSVLTPNELLRYCRAAICSLAGLSSDADYSLILSSKELKERISARYNNFSFERPRRQYERLFGKYPLFRTACALPALHPGVSPDPSPSPFVSPGLSLSPHLPPYSVALSSGSTSGIATAALSSVLDDSSKEQMTQISPIQERIVQAP